MAISNYFTPPYGGYGGYQPQPYGDARMMGQPYSGPYPSAVAPAGPQPQPPAAQQQNQPQPVGMLKGRPVTGEEEARSIPIDFDGSVMFFPDVSHGRIHTKQLNMQDGSAIFRTYVLADTPQAAQTAPVAPVPVPVETVSKEEIAALYAKVGQLEQEVAQLKVERDDAAKPAPRGGTKNA